jgi:FixJ family two-component response regulator
MKDVPVISIVDDDQSVLSGLSSLFRSMGWQVHTFASAEAFLYSELLTTTHCLVSDVQMPGMSGLELQQRLRADGHEMPTIFISAFESEARQIEAMNQRAFCVLSKPVNATAILRCINKLLADGHDTASL